MSYVIAAPEMITAAATDLATIGSDLSAARRAAAAHTVALVPAAADEVSAGIAHLFSRYAADYHALAGRAMAFHDNFVQNLTAGAHSYAATEAANAASLRPLTASAVPPLVETFLLEQILNLLNLYLNANSLVVSIIQNADSLLISMFGPQLAAKLGLILRLAIILPIIILTAPISIPVLSLLFLFAVGLG